MSPTDLEREVAKFTFTGGLALWGVKLELELSGKSDAILTVVLKVPSRDSAAADGKRDELRIKNMLHCWQLMPAENIASLLHCLVRDAILHEVDEGIMFAGVRVLDPHRHGLT